VLRSRLKSRLTLEAENLLLRQQLNIVIRKLPKRLRLSNSGSPAVDLALPSFSSDVQSLLRGRAKVSAD